MRIWPSLLFISLITFVGCNDSVKKEETTIPKKEKAETQFDTLQTINVIGDFDGDQIKDTLSQYFTGRFVKGRITKIPSQKEYENTIDYYFKNDIQASLVSNNRLIKPLELGVCFGVYCLINIGDNNNDGKDEIALTISYCDYSMLNSCKIYSYCNGNWKKLQQFDVNENSFTFVKGETLDPNMIEDYLEQKNGKWYYMDYLEYIANDSIKQETQMKPLKIKNCN